MDQAENLRRIMQQQTKEESKNARVIAVTSGKGGVGKSSVSVNLAIQFTRMGKSVVILDADFGLANVEVMFGVIPRYNLSDLLYNGKEINDIICDGPEGIKFLSGGSGIANLANLDNEQVKRLITKMSELEKMADIVIIDTGAGINPSVMEFLLSSPETILVTTPEPTSVTDSYALLKALSMADGFDNKNTKIRMIANKVLDEADGKNLYEKLSMVVNKFLNIDIEFLGVIPQDSCITKAIMKQKPVSIMYPNASASKHLERIASALAGNEQTASIQQHGIKGYFKNFFARKNK
jgi:flagellar biosynthesis protein FlhG